MRAESSADALSQPSPIPRLYAIVDAGLLGRAGIPLADFAFELRRAGLRFLQYRDKEGSDAEALERALLLRRLFPAPLCRLLINDRVHLCRPAGFDGVHLGQEDMPPAQARDILGPGAILGFSTHNPSQIAEADTAPVDYLAVGPVYPTSSKENPDPVIGLDGVRAARALTAKPLAAIGGIKAERCRQVLEAGADSVAVITALLPAPGRSARSLAEELLLLTG